MGAPLPKLTHNGVTLSRASWARRLGITPSTLYRRLKAWPLEQALSMPRLYPGEGATGRPEKELPAKFAGEQCPRCHLRGEHVCTPPAMWYVQFRAQATEDARLDTGRKGVGWK